MRIQISEIKDILSNPMLQMKNDFIQNYLQQSPVFIELKNTDFNNLINLLDKKTNNIDIDLIFSLSVNHLLSYYYSDKREENNSKILLFRDKLNLMIMGSGIAIEESLVKILNKLYNFNSFITEIKKNYTKNEEYTQKQFEILMYSLRFVVQSTQNNPNNFYFNLLTPNCKKYIDNNYIIGTLPYNDVRLNSYYYLNTVMRASLTEPTGFYVCTCGQHYTLGDCTCPEEVFNCSNPNCKLKIGGQYPKLLGKEAGQTNHFRILLKEEDKKPPKGTEYSQKAIDKGDIPFILFDEYKKKYVDKLLNMQLKGIQKEEIDIFVKRKKGVRNLNELSFRLLNLILYSHLFSSNMIGYLSTKDLNQFTYGQFSSLRIIEKNWEIMEIILRENGINNIEEFLNIIFNKIIELMKELQDTSTIEKREKFEREINQYLTTIISNESHHYQDEAKKYNQCKETIKNTDLNTFAAKLISENYTSFDGLDIKKEYPYFDMFILSKYPSIEELEECLRMKQDYAKKYCLLYQVLICNEEYGMIENVVNLNRLSNFLLNEYNYKIDRDKAKSIKLSECFNNNKKIDEIKQNLIIPYIKSWDKIKSKCRKYLCRPDMPILDLSENHPLIYFLPDDGEICYGMYLASAYANIISWQNNFINIIIESIGPDSIHKEYLSQLNQEIPVQEATNENVININSETKKKLNNMILRYSMRNIFLPNDKINYSEFNKSVIYDLDSIEEELGKLILPGVKKLKSKEIDEPIKFISFLYETFRSGRSQILSNYNIKYPARDLIQEEERLLYQFIKKNKKYSQNFSKNILSSCQMLIDFIQKENFDKNASIFKIIKKLPEYVKIDENLKLFFYENYDDSDNKNIFSIDTLINIYNLVELLCWDQFKNNLNDQYKFPLENENKKIIKDFINSSITSENLIQKNDIACAVRKLISRYLSGKRFDTDINENNKLFDFIQREDLWKTSLINNDKFEENLFNIFDGIKNKTNLVFKCDNKNNKCDECLMMNNAIKKEYKCKNCNKCNCGLRVGHALEFYELLNEDELNLYKFDIQQINEKEIKNKIESDEEEEICTSTNKNVINSLIGRKRSISKIGNDKEIELENEEYNEDDDDEEI